MIEIWRDLRPQMISFYDIFFYCLRAALLTIELGIIPFMATHLARDSEALDPWSIDFAMIDRIILGDLNWLVK